MQFEHPGPQQTTCSNPILHDRKHTDNLFPGLKIMQGSLKPYESPLNNLLHMLCPCALSLISCGYLKCACLPYSRLNSWHIIWWKGSHLNNPHSVHMQLYYVEIRLNSALCSLTSPGQLYGLHMWKRVSSIMACCTYETVMAQELNQTHCATNMYYTNRMHISST